MLISADSHVVEPPKLWLENLPASLRDRAPRAEKDPGNHHWYFVDPDGERGVDLTASATAGTSREELQRLLAADPDAVVELAGQFSILRLDITEATLPASRSFSARGPWALPMRPVSMWGVSRSR